MAIGTEYINYDERMAGANHPTLSDTLNRALKYHVDDSNESHTLTNILATNNTANANIIMGSGFDIIMGSGSKIDGVDVSEELDFSNPNSTIRVAHKADGTLNDGATLSLDYLDVDFIAAVEGFFTQIEIGGGTGDLYDGYYNYYSDVYDRAGGLVIDAEGNIRTDGYIAGKHRLPIRLITGNYTITVRDDVLLADAAAGNITLYLPGTPAIGDVFNIKKVDVTANSVIVDAIGRTIDGSSTKVIGSQYSSLTVVSDGSNWHII